VGPKTNRAPFNATRKGIKFTSAAADSLIVDAAIIRQHSVGCEQDEVVQIS
jgi:hypothetical protein